MLFSLFNPLSTRHIWKNWIFTVKKLSQTLNYGKIVVVELRIAFKPMSYGGNFLLSSYLLN